jgi:pimeloyl-ACP methyl ester carboxylesterase
MMAEEEITMRTKSKVNTGPVEINYIEEGAHGIPLVLLHEVSYSWQSFLPVLPLLSRCYHTYALDLRGQGAPAMPKAPMRLKSMAKM